MSLIFVCIGNYNILIKSLLIVLVVYIIEFSTGAFLELTTGVCPWKYHKGFHLFGYIRLDYFPFWFIFALIINFVYKILDDRLQ